MYKHHQLSCFIWSWLLIVSSNLTAAEKPSLQQATQSLEQAVHFYQGEVSIEGGYLWRYASDFSEREGELPALPTTAWVQPPGTPSVGQAYLTAWELTGNELCLEAAKQSGLALVKGQLVSGGWDYRIDFAEKDRKNYAYRVDVNQQEATKRKLRNVTTLDDNTTQAALQFLMRLDHALNFKNKPIHESALYALDKLIEAQYPNGAWPQRFSKPPNPKYFPVIKANYPDSWPRKYPKQDYRSYYTFNDNTMADMIETMFLAAEIYQDEKYSAAGIKAGKFLLLAQMPDPQSGWAQQYNAKMHPAWARKFEPASVNGAEAQGVMLTLLQLYQLTGDQIFLEPIPRALAYYRTSILENGQLARFYELKTNRPLYFTKKYEMTYDDGDLPTHYGFKTTNRLDEIELKYNQLVDNINSPFKPLRLFEKTKTPILSPKLTRQASELINSLDERGAWVEPAPNRARSKIPQGTPSLSSRTFTHNLVELAQYIAALKSN